MFKNRLTVYTVLMIFLLTLTQSNAQQVKKKKSTDKKLIAELIGSTKRFVVNLGGNWEMSLDDETWHTVKLPGAQTDNDKIYLRRTIKIDKKIADKFSWELYFLGVDENIEIYFNNQFVGKYLGAMTPFHVQVPQRFIRNGNNELKFIVTAATGASLIIKRQNVFMKKIYTGILRDFFLIGNPVAYLNNLIYQTQPSKNGWKVKTKVSISTGDISRYIKKTHRNDSLGNIGIAKTSIRIEGKIINKKTGITLSSFSPRVVEVESFRTVDLEFITAAYSPLMWTPDTPNLYDLIFTISKSGQVIDEKFVRLGFVSYKVKKNKHSSHLFINGKRILIKGATYIEDFAGGKPVSYARLERDVRRIKMNLGANLIKVKYGTPNPYLLNLCDKYGLLVLVELPLYDVPKSMYSLDEIKVKMLNLADRYVNVFGKHPSLAAWGLFDGVDDTEITTSDYFINVFRKNSDKLIYKVIRFGTKSINTNGIDFLGLRDNRKFNSIEAIDNELLRLTELADRLPVFVEYGYPIKPENHKGYSDPLSLEAQAYYIQNLYHIVQKNKLMGNLINTYRDYYLENPMLIVNNENLYLCSSGLVDVFGKERLAFKTAKALFNNEKEPLLNSGSFSESTPISYIVIGILFSVLIVFYINRYKRFKEYFIRAFIRPYNFFADIRDQRIISNVQTVVLAFILSLTAGLFLSSVIYFFRTDTVTQLMLILLIPVRFVQEFFFTVVWSPELLLTTITFFLFILFFILAGIIRLIALFVRSRIYYKDTLTIVVWSAVPLIILLPFSVILIKLMLFSPALTWVIFITLGLFALWILFRILKAIGIVFDTHPTKTYAIGFSVIIILSIGILSIYQLEYSIFYYSEYIFQTLLS